jgi:hypothetical protein
LIQGYWPLLLYFDIPPGQNAVLGHAQGLSEFDQFLGSGPGEEAEGKEE